MSENALCKVAVVGASGYSGEELLRLLGRHPHSEVVAITSRQNLGKRLADVQPQFLEHPKLGALPFIDSQIDAIVASGAEFAFLALPHGLAAEFAEPLLKAGLRVLDLSADFRLRKAEVFEEFYGGKHPRRIFYPPPFTACPRCAERKSSPRSSWPVPAAIPRA